MTHDEEIELAARKAVAEVVRTRGCWGVDRSELLQVARIGAWRAAERFEPARATYERAREVYLARGACLAAHHAADGELRAHSRLGGEDVETESADPTPAEAYDAKEGKQLVKRELEGLTPIEVYVVLRRLDGLSLAELAREAELSKEGVRKIEVRAITQLRERLNPTVH